jgi:hypothetical protein
MQPILLAAIPEINISEVTRVRDWKVMAECMDHFSLYYGFMNIFSYRVHK